MLIRQIHYRDMEFEGDISYEFLLDPLKLLDMNFAVGWPHRTFAYSNPLLTIEQYKFFNVNMFEKCFVLRVMKPTKELHGVIRYFCNMINKRKRAIKFCAKVFKNSWYIEYNRHWFPSNIERFTILHCIFKVSIISGYYYWWHDAIELKEKIAIDSHLLLKG